MTTLSKIFTLLLLAFAVPLAAQEVKTLCAQTDSLIALRKINDAKTVIESAYAKDAKDVEVLWRLSRVYVLYGDLQPKDAQEKLYVKAQEYADAAVNANDKDMHGYIRRAAANGKVALFKGAIAAASLVKATRKDVEKAIALNNAGKEQLAIAHYILGRTHLKLTETPTVMRMAVGLDWGNLKDALSNLKKAVDLNGGSIGFRLEYGKALAANEQAADARAEFEKIATMRADEVGDEARKTEAADALAKLVGK
jgi:hypothetical protein